MIDESLKKIIILIVALAIGGKILAGLIVKLIDSPTNHIAQNLSLGKFLNNQMKIGESNGLTKHSQPVVKNTVKIPTALFVTSKKKPVAPVTPIVANETVKKPVVVAKADLEKKKKEDDKKEKERRKKRKKKLEELANKKPEVKTTPQFKVTFGPPSKVIVSGSPGGSINNVVRTTIPPKQTLTPTSYTPLVPPKKTVNLEALTDVLVHRPSQSAFKSLMNYYQNRMITSAQFYKILSQMQKSTFLESRKYALEAAEAHHQPESFQFLVTTMHTENEDPGLKQQAHKNLVSYARIEDLSILLTEMKSNDINSQLEATLLLRMVMTQYESVKPPNPAQDPNQLFSPFKQLLEVMAQDASKPQLQEQALANLDLMNRILTPTPAQSQPVFS